MAIFFLLTWSRSCVHDCGPARSLSWITYPRIRSQECVSRLRLREPGSSICRPIRPTSTLLNKPGRRSNKSCAHSRHAPPMRLKPQSLRLSPRLVLRMQSPGFPIVATVYNKFENALVIPPVTITTNGETRLRQVVQKNFRLLASSGGALLAYLQQP